MLARSRVGIFWQSIGDLKFSELEEIASTILTAWTERDCEKDALNFAAALSDYAAAWAEENLPEAN